MEIAERDEAYRDAIDAPRRGWRGPVVLCAGVVVVAVLAGGGFAAYRWFDGTSPTPLTRAQLTALDGTWVGSDGVTITFDNSGLSGSGDDPGDGGHFTLTVTDAANWATAAGLTGRQTGAWTFGGGTASSQVAIDLHLNWTISGGGLVEPAGAPSTPVILLAEGNADSPTLVCPQPTDADPCTLTKQN